MTVAVSVVICAYTEKRWVQLQAAVRSALSQRPAPLEVVVVIDHCAVLEDRVEALFGSTVRVVPNRFAAGLSGARNTGVAMSSGDVVAFLDDDARAEPGWLSAHARHYDAPDVVGVGGRVLPVWAGGAPRWFPEEFGWVVGCSYTGLPRHSAPVRNPIGANMSFRSRAIEAAGGFSPALGRLGATPLGCEETELSIRVAKVVPGARIMYEPAAVVRHHVDESRGRVSYFTRRCWAEGVSKARVSRLSGPQQALRSERAYVTRTLPTGIGREFATTVSGRDPWPLARAATMLGGLTVTAAGYASGRLRGAAHLRRSTAGERA